MSVLSGRHGYYEYVCDFDMVHTHIISCDFDGPAGVYDENEEE